MPDGSLLIPGRPEAPEQLAGWIDRAGPGLCCDTCHLLIWTSEGHGAGASPEEIERLLSEHFDRCESKRR